MTNSHVGETYDINNLEHLSRSVAQLRYFLCHGLGHVSVILVLTDAY